jgi:serine/threonine protein kinase
MLFMGRYQLHAIIGQGLCGRVWKALDTKSNPPAWVAIKFIQEDSGPEGQIIRAKREAEALSRVSHPGIITIYGCLQDTGTPVAQPDGHVTFDFSHNTACIIMQYVGDGNLAMWLQDKQLTLGLLCHILLPIYDALETIHQAGIVHRDLKPSNILMACDRPIITDFGLSRISDATTITKPGTIMGTLDYLSPEQARAKKADVRSDLYATGAIIWKLLFKKPVFTGAGPLIQLRRISCDPLPQDIETLPPAFQYILRRLLAKNVQLRFQSAAEVERVLKEFLRPDNAELEFSPFTHKAEPGRYKGIKLPTQPVGNPELSKTQEKPRDLPHRPTRRSRRYRETSSLLLRCKEHMARHVTMWTITLVVLLVALILVCWRLLC